MKKSVFLKMILETFVFIALLVFSFLFLNQPVLNNTIIIIASLATVISILIYLTGNYFVASLFNIDMMAVLWFIFALGGGAIFILVSVVFLILFFISATERDQLKVLVYRDIRNILNLSISFILILIATTVLTFLIFPNILIH